MCLVDAFIQSNYYQLQLLISINIHLFLNTVCIPFIPVTVSMSVKVDLFLEPKVITDILNILLISSTHAFILVSRVQSHT